MAIDALQPMYQDSQFTTESLVRGIDFTNILTPNGDSLSGTPTVTASVLYGADTSPQNILSGSPLISSGKTQVLQRISGGVGVPERESPFGVRILVKSIPLTKDSVVNCESWYMG